MDEDTLRPPRSPGRPRRRVRRPGGPPHLVRRADEVTARHSLQPIDPPELQMAGGSGFGRGPVDDDGRGRKPERPDGNGATQLLIALGLIALGAGVMSARLLSQAGRRRR